jgi:hypothetical protein
MADKKVDSKFVGTFFFSLRSVRVKPECYGEAAMIISTLLSVDREVAEQIVADSGKPSLDVTVKDLIKLQLVKICLNKAGVFVGDNKLNVTDYFKKNANRSIPDLVGNDNVAKEAYYEAYKLFRSTYADMFNITVPKVNDIEDEDKIDVASFENHEQETEAKPECYEDWLDNFLDELRDHFDQGASTKELDRARKYYYLFRSRLIIMELMVLEPEDPTFNIVDKALHGSKD